MGLLFIPQIIYEYGATVKLYWERKIEELKKNLSHCHFAHHKSHME
jgi:hypothetical protein